ncbi:MAG: NAD(P)/FAD-dependent oxidoreductase [Polyangiales bacterium]
MVAHRPTAQSDVVVVGGGPAGLATGLAAAHAGLSVTVLESRQPPLDKACGEGLMAPAVAQLRAWGLASVLDAAPPLKGLHYIHDEHRLTVDLPGAAWGRGLRRSTLHQALTEAARRAGVRLVWGVKVTGHRVHGRGVEVDTSAGECHRAHWLVGADGLHSRVRSRLDPARLRRPKPPRHVSPQAVLPSCVGPAVSRWGLSCHLRCAPWSEHIEVYWGPQGEAYVTPVGPHEVNIALLLRGKPGAFASHLADYPALHARVRGAPVSSSVRGAGPLRQRVRVVARERIALVGDAAGYVDAITGEGVHLALQQAVALAPLLAAGDIRPYARRHRAIVRAPHARMHALLALGRWPTPRAWLFAALARHPAPFRVLARWSMTG